MLPLYYYKSDNGIEYLTEAYQEYPDGHREGIVKEGNYVICLYGDIKEGAELFIRDANADCKDE